MQKITTPPSQASVSGIMMIWPTDTAPTGWLLCYGQAVSRANYAALFALLGTTFGIGDGATTFNLPDLRGRVPLGQDDMGGVSANRVTNVQADAIAGAAGAESHTLVVNELAFHDHTITTNNGGAAGTFMVSANGSATTGNSETNSTGGNHAHNNVQPYLTLNYIIKV